MARSALGVFVGALGLTMLAPTAAQADPAADAKDLFARGRDLRAHGDCAAAATLFRKASELFPTGLGSVRNLAECEEQLGHFASARRAWLDLRRGLVTIDDHKYDGWSQDADRAATRLAPLVATLTIDLNVVDPGGARSQGHGVEVSLDGEPLAPALIGTALERDPGRHVVRVAGERVLEAQQQAVSLAAGDAKRLALRVTVAAEATEPDAASQPAGAPPAEDPSEHARATRRTLAWIALGTGAAALAGAGISLAVRQSALDEVNHQCPGDSNCSPGLQPTVSRGQLASTLFDVLGVVGVVSVAGGVVLFTTSSRPAPQTSFVLVPGLGGASARWSF